MSPASTRSYLGSTSAAFTRYRVVAWIVGVGLIILVFIGVPLRYGFGNESVVEVVGPLHGFLFMLYLVLVLDLAIRCRWSLLRTGLIMAAGTIPVMSFVAERKVSGWAREHELVEPPHSTRTPQLDPGR